MVWQDVALEESADAVSLLGRLPLDIVICRSLTGVSQSAGSPDAGSDAVRSSKARDEMNSILRIILLLTIIILLEARCGSF